MSFGIFALGQTRLKIYIYIDRDEPKRLGSSSLGMDYLNNINVCFRLLDVFATVCTNEYNPDDGQTLLYCIVIFLQGEWLVVMMMHSEFEHFIVMFITMGAILRLNLRD